FDKVPDREPLAQPASTAPAPAPALPQASAPPAKTLTDGKLEAQRRARALRAAMAAPIAAVALGARSGMARGGGSERPATRTESGQHLLVPQGARLIGLYDHHVAYGQERVLVTWKRVIFPNGSRLSLKDGMPGTDPAGAAGFNHQVNHRLVRVLGNALLLSVF